MMGRNSESTEAPFRELAPPLGQQSRDEKANVPGEELHDRGTENPEVKKRMYRSINPRNRTIAGSKTLEQKSESTTGSYYFSSLL